MDHPPEVRYVSTPDGSIAYQSFGGGAGCLVVVPGWLSHIEAAWSLPELTHFLLALARFTRVVLVDMCGVGLADSGPVTTTYVTEGRARDLATLMDALALPTASFMGISDGCLGVACFAAAHPDRVDALVLWAPWARWHSPKYPQGLPQAVREERVRIIAERWGNDSNPMWLEVVAPERASDPEWRLWLAHAERIAASPARGSRLAAAVLQVDLRDVMRTIGTRALVLQSAGDQLVPAVNAREVASLLPNARYVELGSPNHFPDADCFSEVAALIQGFLTGSAPQERAHRRVATIVVTDVVESTQAVSTLGNGPWADVLARMHAGLRDQAHKYGGSVVDTAGDGVLSVFELPRQAIRCAESMLGYMRTLHLEARAGVHIGEIEIRGDLVAGLAVHTAVRISCLAAAGEVLTSRTVKDLLAGSSLEFTGRGTHTLKGVPDQWEVFRVRTHD